MQEELPSFCKSNTVSRTKGLQNQLRIFSFPQFTPKNLHWKRCWTSFAYLRIVFESILGFLNAKCNLIIFLNKYFVITWLEFDWVVLIQIRIQSFSSVSYSKTVFRIAGSWHQVIWHEIDTSLNEFIFTSAHKPREALYVHIKAQAGVRLFAYPYLHYTPILI